MKRKICMLSILSISLLNTFSLESQAIQTKYYYDGETPRNLEAAGTLAKGYSNSSIYKKRFGHATNSPLNAIGYIRNMNGFAGPGIEVQGTGTVIGNYTVLTNAHLIDNKFQNATKPVNLKFQMNRDGSYIPYSFGIKSIRKIPNSDLALIYTTSRLTNYVQPLKFATETQINQLKKGQSLYSVGYPYISSTHRSYRYFYKLLFLRNSFNKNELMTKDLLRGGNSGSPMLDKYNRIYGVRTYGERVDGYDENQWAKFEVAGGFAIKGAVRNYITKYDR